MASVLPAPCWTRRRALCTLAVLTLPAWAGEPLRVMHQGPESEGDTRNDYYWQLLRAALEATRERWGDFQLLAGGMMNGLRTVRQLQEKQLNIILRSTSRQLESELRPIRIPLDKGLRGFRVFLIRRQLQARLDQVRTLADLQRFSIGQHSAWNDVEVLEAAGFNVVRGGSYEGLFEMASLGRFDLFSRSAAEAVAELQGRHTRFPDLTIERNLLLYYPLAPYLFVRRDVAGEQLAIRVEAGLEMILKDGSFDRIFNAYKAPVEQSLNLRGRRLLRIPNPLLSAETPLKRSELWYDPTR